MKLRADKGFTLIELAIVIVIVGILAAVAIPRFANTSVSAEKAVAKDFLSQVRSASAIYLSEQSKNPTGFTDFVDTANPPGAGKTVSVATLGKGGCTVAAATINCATAFPNTGAVVYSWNSGSPLVTCAGGSC